uniref:Uncharacterized protein n=1 Tax=Chromera velia CCMP2878 TaxID=1169474 RepID=A0A0G4IE27_9ALVE|mmetsp:Transcript_3127/g.6457  ORF Transcript_3127/g.6457 Transcript_3127/m.6457 type:complete len:297 (+) Transcript_3127:535-1425(+)|eukprot:Cvel_13618.t1-p1 / transcript=Cvel_13618.t1 / gene=Cvel_13618 / organism=Chromera_velia_CCMP2878 / gene_product=Ankyrin-3, putative / transcript_product=Ankyrin-3, putative / location=Cvel_scaffold937:57900-58787(+) / protein_length=296 / sequence_SO=supercontig / SO=protein_coding / is_pseudo=false
MDTKEKRPVSSSLGGVNGRVDGHTALLRAVRARNFAAVKILVEAGAGLEVCGDENGDTPLHLTCRLPSVPIAQFLVSRGANVNAESLGKRRPLHVAARTSTPKLLEILLSSGAEVDAKATGGSTALHKAADAGRRENVQTLLDRGAKVNERGLAQRTPLLWSVNFAWNTAKSAQEVAELLLSHGADVTASDSDGQTVLHLAVLRASVGSYSLVEFLLDRGADLHATNQKGATALHFCVVTSNDCLLQAERARIAEMLVSRGIDANAVDHMGETALAAAKRNLAEHSPVRLFLAGLP